jgi:hypothetical protein
LPTRSRLTSRSATTRAGVGGPWTKRLVAVVDRGGLIGDQLGRPAGQQRHASTNPRSASVFARSSTDRSVVTDKSRELAPDPVRALTSAPGAGGGPRRGDRQHVGSLVERVADVPLDPVPANLLVV